MAIASVYLARVLGPHKYGLISFSQAFVVYFSMFTDSGLKALSLRELAGEPINAAYRDNIFTTRLFLTLVSLTSFALVIAVIDFDSETHVTLAVFGSLILTSGLSIDWLWMAREKTKGISISELIKSVLYATAIFVIISSDSSAWIIPAFLFVATSISIGYLYLSVRGTELLPSITKQFSPIWHTLKTAFPLGATQGLITLYYYLDQVMLGFFAEKEIVGFYSAPYKIINLGVLGFTLFLSAFVPFLTRLYDKDDDLYYEIVSLIGRALIAVLWPVGVYLTFFAEEIIGLLFGPSYFQSIPLLKLLLCSFVLIGTRLLFENYFIISRQLKRYLFFTAFYFLINLGINLWLIPSFLATGAAIATVLADAVFLVVLMKVLPTQLFSNYRIWLTLIVAISVVTAFLKEFSSLNPKFLVVGSLLTYGTIIYFHYNRHRDDFRNLLDRVKSAGIYS